MLPASGAGPLLAPSAPWFVRRPYQAAGLPPSPERLLMAPPAACVQGDIGFAQVLQQMGASVEMTPHSVTVTGGPPDPATGRRLRGIDIDMNAMPDVAMTLAVLGLFADGPVAIRNGEPHPKREREAGKVAQEAKCIERSLRGLERAACLLRATLGGRPKEPSPAHCLDDLPGSTTTKSSKARAGPRID